MNGKSGWARTVVAGVAVGVGLFALAPAAKAQVVVGGSVGVYRPGVSVGVTFGQPPVVVAPFGPVVPVVPAYGYPVPVYRPYGYPVYGGYNPYPHHHHYHGPQHYHGGPGYSPRW